MKFTCLIPTHDNGAAIAAAIESVQAQTIGDWELLIVCDGAPPQTIDIAEAVAATDPRVRLFKFAKGERHGEAWRHSALLHAAGEAVCYLGDDDAWLPNHLATIQSLLSEADFAHTRHTYITPDFRICALNVGMDDPAIRHAMLHQLANVVGPTAVGHRLSAYRRLQQGWAPAPPDVMTDLHMWRKWIAASEVRFASSAATTTLHIPRSLRRDRSCEAALNEANYWRIAFRDPRMQQALGEILTAETECAPLSSIAARVADLS